MAYPVKWYASQMQGAPSLGDTADGALTALLKAVLVTGFGTLTLNSLVWDATEGAAKATIAAGHAYLPDSVVEVSGASPAAYNGEHRVKKVSTTEVWIELDGGNPGSAASGAMSMKVAPLGWTLTHESADQKVAIYRPTDVSASGNVSLRIDNTAFSGWTGPNVATTPMYLAKVQMVEDVVDINTYTLIADQRWPCTARYSDRRWDFIGDSQLIYFLPSFGAANRQHPYLFGYLKSIRPSDRYHALLVAYASASPPASSAWSWSNGVGGTASFLSSLPVSDDSTSKIIARPYSQLFGTAIWWIKGLFSRIGSGLSVPNGPDNGFHLSQDPIMIVEANNHLRGYLPGMVCPYATVSAWDRKNFANLPAMPNKLLRFILTAHSADALQANPTMLGFDLTGPWR